MDALPRAEFESAEFELLAFKKEPKMKDAVLIELAGRWEREATAPECADGSKEAEIPNAIAKR